MKKFLLCVIFAVLGIAFAVGSAWNEGGSIGGAWVGVVYAIVFSAFVALVEYKAFERPWKEIGTDVAVIIGGAIIGAIGFTIL